VKVKLLLRTDDVSKVPNNYKEYWFDNFNDFANKIKFPILMEKGDDGNKKVLI